MKTYLTYPTLLLCLALTAVAAPLGTQFTYQGRLNDSSGSLGGQFDMTFGLHLDASSGTALITVTNLDVSVSTNGLFTTPVDFGPGVFSGAAHWLEIGVRTNGSSDPFTPLTPRQPLTPTPNAHFAILAGTVTNGAINAEKIVAGPAASGNVLAYSGGNLMWTNAAAVAGGWRLSGNSGTAPGANFVGTTDHQPLDFRVGNFRALRLEPSPLLFFGPNVIGGYNENFVGPGVYGATIAGGGATNGFNQVLAHSSTIGGGGRNAIHVFASAATIAGGHDNTIQQNASWGTVSGGFLNTIRTDSDQSTISGGVRNTIEINCRSSTIGGGSDNTNHSDVTSIGGGSENRIQSGAYGATIAGGRFNLVGSGANHAAVAGGASNTVWRRYGSVGGGTLNIAESEYSTVSGGGYNQASGRGAVVGGGGGLSTDGLLYPNVASGDLSVVSGGGRNTSSGNSSVVSGGVGNTSSSEWAVVGGGLRNLASGNAATVGGGSANTNTGFYTTIAGGVGNKCSINSGVVGGGSQNECSGGAAVVPGGSLNVASGNYSFAAGQRAKATHTGAFVWADSQDADFSSTAADQFAIRAGGGVRFSTNTPNLSFDGANTSIVFPPTSAANAPMIHMFAAGTGNSPRMVLAHSATYSNWGLQYDDVPDRFNFLAEGSPVMTVALGSRRVGIGTNTPTSALEVLGEVKATVLTPTSDRAAKENFQPVNSQEILAKVAALPIARWNFKALPGAEHIGPVAQDFRAAFGVGSDDKHITTVDADGVALAAIQGLNQKLQEELKQKDAKIASLEQRLARLEEFLTTNGR